MADETKTTGDEFVDVETLGFEQAQAELEAIVQRLEDPRTGLDQALALWERGEALHAWCQARLDNAQARIEKLQLSPEESSAAMAEAAGADDFAHDAAPTTAPEDRDSAGATTAPKVRDSAGAASAPVLTAADEAALADEAGVSEALDVAAKLEAAGAAQAATAKPAEQRRAASAATPVSDDDAVATGGLF